MFSYEIQSETNGNPGPTKLQDRPFDSSYENTVHFRRVGLDVQDVIIVPTMYYKAFFGGPGTCHVFP